MQLGTLVKEFLLEYQIREYTPQIVENYRKQLRHFTEFMSAQFLVQTLEEVQPSYVKAFIKHYQLRQRCDLRRCVTKGTAKQCRALLSDDRACPGLSALL